jgi:hypothetical protein
MSALLHIVDPQGPGASGWLSRMAAQHGGGGQVVALGASAHGAAFRIPFSGGSVALAARSLERLCDEVQARVVIAWGARAAAVAAQARDAAERWLVLDAVPPLRSIPFDAEVICLGDAVADQLSAAGWPPMRLRVAQVPSPCMAEPDHDGSRRAALRKQCGVPDAAFVAGLLPAGPDAGDALSAFHAVGRVRMTGVDAHLVLASDAGLAGPMQVFARSIGLRDAVHFVDAVRDPASVAPMVDAWLSLRGACDDATALDPAVAAGLHAPLVAALGSLAASAVEPDVDGLVAEGRNRIGAALLELSRDPARCRDLSTAARARFAGQDRRQAFARMFDDIAARARVSESNRSAAPA